jgi:DNA-binding FrmR family transcriptional regulator
VTATERREKLEAIKRMANAGNPCWAILALIEVIEADQSQDRVRDVIHQRFKEWLRGECKDRI